MGANDMVRRLRTVADLERIAIDDEALQLIARHATGSLRDALGYLEQLVLHADQAPGESDSSAIDIASVRTTLGLSHSDRVEQLVTTIAHRDAGGALRIVQEAIDGGEDARQLNRQLLSYLRLLMIERSGGSSEADDRVRKLAAMFSLTELAVLARRFGAIDFTIKHSPYPQLPIEIALVESTAPQNLGNAAAIPEHDAHQTETANAPLPTSLRDRVRSTSSIREVPQAEHMRSPQTPPAPITPLHANRTNEPVEKQKVANTGGLDVEQIADMWPRVRADVKALNRRIEALLSEVDPVAISGNVITLAVPYPFHRDKLNSDEVSETLSGVLSRLLDRDLTVICILRGEMTAPVATSTAAIEPAVSVSAERVSAPVDDDQRARIRLRAAINIFDAEEIAELPAADKRTSNESV
ncbi:MAG: hypothetical protein H0T18_04560 [Chloroflexia bacterium]|nr:hypothetical protein [Chloroflexia bacterium]